MRILKLIRSFGKINNDYYKYAFIEIFLIIVGILIALEVNNANENRKLKLEEKKTLLAFHNEVSSSLLNLNLVLDKKRGIVNSDREILKYTGPNGRWNSEFKLDSLIYHVATAGWRHVPQEGVLNEIINNGKLSIINDEKIKSQIASLPKAFSQILENDRINRLYINTYIIPFLSKSTSLMNMTNFDKTFEYSNNSLGFTKFNFYEVDILRNREFENMLSWQSQYMKFGIEFLEKLKIKYVEIQKMIEIKYPEVDYKNLNENLDRGVWN